jgi:hypothetical protein
MRLALHQVHTAGRHSLAVINAILDLLKIQAGRKGRG